MAIEFSDLMLNQQQRLSCNYKHPAAEGSTNFKYIQEEQQVNFKGQVHRLLNERCTNLNINKVIS